MHRSFDLPGLRLCVAFSALVLLIAPDSRLRGTEAANAPAQETRARAGDAAKKPLPLEAARVVEFDTSEGSWISLDVSPDGKTILFELLGDLHTVPIEGGEATRITSGMGFDTQPRYSPDGSKIVFISDRGGADNLWIANKDGGNATALTKGKTDTYRSPDWTPDGQYVVASKLSGQPPSMHLRLYHVQGGSGVQLTGNSDEQRNLYTLGAAFGSDPRYVWFTERTASGSVYNQMRFRWQIGVYDRQTGEYYRQSDEQGSAMRPTISPDGHWLVYATRWDAQTGLRVRDLRSGDDSWLLYPVQRDDQESASTRDLMPGSSFTPDSKALITSFDGRLWRVEVPSGKVSPIPFTAKVKLDVGPKLTFQYSVDEGLVRVQQIRHPRLSPDGRTLAFSALDRVYVMDYPKGTPRRVSDMEVAEHHPTWSPDGRFVAYVTWSDEDGGHIYRTAADRTTPPERLTEVAAFYSDPVYAPDGKRLVAVRGPRVERQEDYGPVGRGGQALELVWLPADGGAVTVAAPFRGNRPQFSRDPSRIYTWEVRRTPAPPGGGGGTATGTLVSFRFDGTDRRAHVRVTGWKPPTAERAQPADDVRISADGEHGLVDVNRKLYVVTIPKVGGDTPPTIDVGSTDGAAVPVLKLTNVGGEFAEWTPDGKAVTWALGRTFFYYDVAAGRAAEAVRRAGEEKQAAAKGDEAARDEEKQADARRKLPHEAVETEIVIEVPRPAPRGVVALRGARILTMNGNEVIEQGDVLVRDNRIEAFGRRGQIRIPAGATTIDVSGKTIMPGLIDIHAHIWPAWDIHKTQVWEYLANLSYGVTTTRDPQTATTDILTYRDMVEAGRMIGPRVYGTGPGVFSSDDIQSLDEARDVLKRYSRYWDTKTIKQYMAGNRQQRQWIVMAAREQQLMPTLEGGLDLKLNLTQMLDGYPGLEHTLPITPLYKDVVQLAAQAGLTYTPTLLVQYGGPWAENYYYENGEDLHSDLKMRRFTPHIDLDEAVLRRPWFHPQEYSFPQAAKVLADIVRAGGRVGLGGHGQRQGLQCHWELQAIASGGMSNHDVLRVATIWGAEAIGLAQDIGSIQKGKLADLIVLDRNPLEDIRNTNSVRYVMKNGELYDAATLDQIWPVRKKLPRQYWWDQEPPVRSDAPPRPALAGRKSTN